MMLMMLTGEYRKLAAISKRYGKHEIKFSLPLTILMMPTSDSLPQVKARLPGLDYLRGLAAFGIMVYHYSSWSFGEQTASSFLGRVGIYGVAIFYVLSGQTLSYIYSSRLQLASVDLRKFYKRRFFRIFPLLWLATLLSIVLSKRVPNVTDLFLNLTGLFSLFKWDTYFATGAWSIGNELCFYLTLPLLIFLFNKSITGFLVVVLSATVICGYFAFSALLPSIPLAMQWHAYTNPLNQFLFFLGGVVIGKIIQPTTIKKWQSVVLGLVGFIAFAVVPVHGNAIALVTGPNRIFFIASCFLLCISFFRNAHAPSFIDRPLSILGQISYSLYLLHPLVYAVTKAVFSVVARTNELLTSYILPLSLIISLVASYISYQYFERFFIRISHKAPFTNSVS
jgi:exopolysaccharide production protein ExoZ